MDFAAAFDAERRPDRAADDRIAACAPAFPVRATRDLAVFKGGDLLHPLARSQTRNAVIRVMPG